MLSKAAIKSLENYSWKGNVRELENVIQRALIMTSGSVIEDCDLVFETEQPNVMNSTRNEEPVTKGLSQGVKAAEDELILETLKDVNGSRKNTAERLGISARTLRYKIARMKDSGITIPA